MRALACLLWTVPAMAGNFGPKPLYADSGRLAADVRRAFVMARDLALLPEARLQVLDRDDPRNCGTGAYSELAYMGARSFDTVSVCSNLRFVAANFEQVFFMISHELGHLKYRHARAGHGKGGLLRQEFEADEFAVALARRAGYDPAQGALTQLRMTNYLAAVGRTDSPGHDRLKRARRILRRDERIHTPQRAPADPANEPARAAIRYAESAQ